MMKSTQMRKNRTMELVPRSDSESRVQWKVSLVGKHSTQIDGSIDTYTIPNTRVKCEWLPAIALRAL